eukprot:scaffold180306_cov30-Tisochrysis_lutea.AAC.3
MRASRGKARADGTRERRFPSREWHIRTVRCCASTPTARDLTVRQGTRHDPLPCPPPRRASLPGLAHAVRPLAAHPARPARGPESCPEPPRSKQ